MHLFSGFICQWFESRGFGFIRLTDANRCKFFAHYSQLPNGLALPIGTPVTFQLGKHLGRPVAINVQAADGGFVKPGEGRK